MPAASTLALHSIRSRIVHAAKAAGREPGSVTLVAVSKTFSAPDILPVLAENQIDFGENRVQEAKGKWPELVTHYPATKLHLIGPLQTNKVADAIKLFDAIHSLDRPSLALALGKVLAKADKPIELFIQVNTGDEAQKAGVHLQEADGFIDACREAYKLAPVGLMCIPPVAEAPERHFEILARLAEKHGLKKLSMGMSADFEAAIAHGATHVRVGSSIFGAR